MAGNYSGKYARSVLGGSDILSNPQSSSANQWYGAGVFVGSSTVVISTSLVNTSSVIHWSFVANQVGSEAAGFGSWIVKSINPGNAFVLGTVASCALVSSYQLNWVIFGPTRNW